MHFQQRESVCENHNIRLAKREEERVGEYRTLGLAVVGRSAVIALVVAGTDVRAVAGLHENCNKDKLAMKKKERNNPNSEMHAR